MLLFSCVVVFVWCCARLLFLFPAVCPMAGPMNGLERPFHNERLSSAGAIGLRVASVDSDTAGSFCSVIAADSKSTGSGG